MDLGAILIGLAMLVLAVPYVIRPFRPVKQARGKRTALMEPGIPVKGLEVQRHLVLKKLSDLDFDYQTGKVAEEDHQAMRGELVAEASRLIEAVNREEERLEQQIRARREARAQKALCPHCRGVLRPQDRFCPTCGQPIVVSCPQCGKPVQPKDLFCTACGSQLGKSASNPATLSTVQEEGK